MYNTKATQLIVYNINGDLVANENITHQTMCQFHRNNLSNGMYFYVIKTKKAKLLAAAKLCCNNFF
ncbi:MAG: T9SS type A sorting domain-containing protein [Saprospirales bacterium]|nr:T9SS type A sorting domain-containing protein [Saprospirales bacterium]